jgi:hypothetical protein
MSAFDPKRTLETGRSGICAYGETFQLSVEAQGFFKGILVNKGRLGPSIREYGEVPDWGPWRNAYSKVDWVLDKHALLKSISRTRVLENHANLRGGIEQARPDFGPAPRPSGPLSQGSLPPLPLRLAQPL